MSYSEDLRREKRIRLRKTLGKSQKILDIPLIAIIQELHLRLEGLHSTDPLVQVWWDQMISAVTSVGANFVEGVGRSDYSTQYLQIARGSAVEAQFWSTLTKNPELVNLTITMNRLLDKEIKKFIKKIDKLDDLFEKGGKID